MGAEKMRPTVRVDLGANGRTLSSAEEQRAVMAAVEPIVTFLPRSKEVVVVICDPVRPGSSLVEAHRGWTELHFPEIKTPAHLPRQQPETPCPSGLIKVLVNCIDERTPGMGSYYQFRGYALSLLISLKDGTIWDARGERAS
jgi:hypothetical protein